MYPALSGLIDQLGLEDATDLVKVSLPILADWRAKLSHALEAGDMDAAAKLAHRAISSVRLYGTERLELLLRRLTNREVQQQSEVVVFEEKLSAEFQFIEQTLQQWLSEQPA